MGKTSCKANTALGEFKVITPKNPLINNHVVKSIRNLTTTLIYPKYQPTVEPFTIIPSWT